MLFDVWESYTGFAYANIDQCPMLELLGGPEVFQNYMKFETVSKRGDFLWEIQILFSSGLAWVGLAWLGLGWLGLLSCWLAAASCRLHKGGRHSAAPPLWNPFCYVAMWLCGSVAML